MLDKEKYSTLIIKPLEVHYLSIYAQPEKTDAVLNKVCNPDICWTKVTLQTLNTFLNTSWDITCRLFKLLYCAVRHWWVFKRLVCC